MALLSSCRPGWHQQTPQPVVANEGVIWFTRHLGGGAGPASLTHSLVPPPDPSQLSPPSPLHTPVPLSMSSAPCSSLWVQLTPEEPHQTAFFTAEAAVGPMRHITTLIFLLFLYYIFKRQYLLYCEFAVEA